MLLVESMVKRQHIYTERNRERINNIKSKYSLFKNLLCNMRKNMEEICNEKKRIEGKVESMRLGRYEICIYFFYFLFYFFYCYKTFKSQITEFSKLTTEHKSTLENNAATSQARMFCHAT